MMGRERRDTTEKVLRLILEIIYLLTGEDSEVVKKTSGERLTFNIHLHDTAPITAFPPHSMTPEINDQKIVEATKKMMELLTGEVPIRCQDVSVYFSMEEWEYLEGHRDLYKDVVMEDQKILQHCQSGSLTDFNVIVKEEIKDDTDEDDVTESIEGHNDLYKDIMMGDQPPLTSPDGSSSMAHLVSSPSHSAEDPDVVQCSPEHPFPQSLHCSLYHVERSADCSDLVDSSTRNGDQTFMGSEWGESFTFTFPCSECEKSFRSISELSVHHRIHTGEKIFTCSECERSFIWEEELIVHQRVHTHEKPFSCPQCGRCFSHKGKLNKHLKCHTSARPFSCPECGKCFIEKGHLLSHQRGHTGELPFSCSECKKSFISEPKLIIHQRSHTGEKPFLCSMCGKCFSQKGHLTIHLKHHSGEKPFTCAECGKRFIEKTKLLRHQKCHMGERPFSCSECGKCYTRKEHLIRHLRLHDS